MAGLLRSGRRTKMRILFQNEGRFRRISDARSCWAPLPLRPAVGSQLVREFVYACLRVPRRRPDDLADLALGRCPADGPVPCPYCGPVSQRVLRPVPGWHRAHELAVPTNMKLLALPPYSPELNPAEHIWEYLRENEMRNRIFNDLDEVMDAVETSLYHLYQKPETLRSMAAFPWILEAAA